MNLLCAGTGELCLMADYDVEKIKKIIGMLQSEHDGEAAAAARMLHMHAKKQAHSIVEMLTEIFGGAAKPNIWSDPPPRQPPPPPPQDDRNAFWASAAKAQAQPPPWGPDPFNPGAGGWNPPPPPPPGPPWMDILLDMVDRHGISMLTPWEQNFVNDLADRGARFLSEKQQAVVVKIVAKYRQWEDTGNCGFHNVGR